MTIFKTSTTRLFIRYWWSWYIYWIPTIQTCYHKKEEGALTNFTVSGENKSYKGSEIEVSLIFLMFTLEFSFWFNIEER